MRVSALGAAFLALGITGAVAAEGKALSGGEIAALIGESLSIRIADLKGGAEYTGTLVLKRDGTGSGSVEEGGKTTTVSGIWSLKGDRFCRTWKPFDSKAVCETWMLTGAKEVTVYIGKKAVGKNFLP